MLQTHRPLGCDRECDFLANSGSRRRAPLPAIAQAGFTHASVSSNRWTTDPAAAPARFSAARRSSETRARPRSSSQILLQSGLYLTRNDWGGV
jgi:hypothetical protein